MKENELQNKHTMESLSSMNQQIRPGKFPMDINNFDGQQPAASKFDPSLHLLDVNKMNLSKSIETSSRYFCT